MNFLRRIATLMLVQLYSILQAQTIPQPPGPLLAEIPPQVHLDKTFDFLGGHYEGVFDAANCEILQMLPLDDSSCYVIQSTVFTNLPNLFRIQRNGRLDTNFTPMAIPWVNRAAKAWEIPSLVMPDHSLVIGVRSSSQPSSLSPSYDILRVDSSGAVREHEFPVFEPRYSIRSMALDHEGRLLLAGTFNRLGEKSISSIARLTREFAFDESIGFRGGSLRFGRSVNNVWALMDGGYLATTDQQILKFDASGQQLGTNIFNAGVINSTTTGSYNGSKRMAMRELPDGKMEFCGDFLQSRLGDFAYSPTSTRWVMRTFVDGFEDPRFGLHRYSTLMIGAPRYCSFGSDGRIRMVADTNLKSPKGVPTVLRFHRDGSIDGSFGPENFCSDSIRGVVVRQDGRTLIWHHPPTTDPAPKPVIAIHENEQSIRRIQFTDSIDELRLHVPEYGTVILDQLQRIAGLAPEKRMVITTDHTTPNLQLWSNGKIAELVVRVPSIKRPYYSGRMLFYRATVE